MKTRHLVIGGACALSLAAGAYAGRSDPFNIRPQLSSIGQDDDAKTLEKFDQLCQGLMTGGGASGPNEQLRRQVAISNELLALMGSDPDAMMKAADKGLSQQQQICISLAPKYAALGGGM